MPAPLAVPGALPFALVFGGRATTEISSGRECGLELQIPLLGGHAREAIFPAAQTFGERDGLRLIDSPDLRIGWVAEPVADERGLQKQTEALYRRVLAAAAGRHLYRIWNYVPRINALSEGLENYRAFCLGRSLAFEEAAGDAFSKMLPAASAVGTEDGFLSLVFVAGTATPRHVENPEQVPAYHYPAEHGPRPPSFSRATIVTTGGRRFTFISGTAAIKGHTTVAAEALGDQLDCTLDNLKLVSREAGTGDDLDADKMTARHFKIYLRHAADFAVTRDRLEQSLLRPNDIVTYLQADICRIALRVEIEATLVAKV